MYLLPTLTYTEAATLNRYVTHTDILALSPRACSWHLPRYSPTPAIWQATVFSLFASDVTSDVGGIPMQYGSTGLEASPLHFMTFPVNIASAGRLRSLKCPKIWPLTCIILPTFYCSRRLSLRSVASTSCRRMCVPALTLHRIRVSGR